MVIVSQALSSVLPTDQLCWSPHCQPEMGMITTPSLWMRKLRHRTVCHDQNTAPGDSDRPGFFDFLCDLVEGISPFELQGRRREDRKLKRVWNPPCPGAVQACDAASSGHPLEEVRLSPCYRQGNCCLGKLRHLPNITQQVCGRARIQTQIPLIFSTPRRLL